MRLEGSAGIGQNEEPGVSPQDPGLTEGSGNKGP